MKTKTEATIEDLYRISGKAELVNGEIAFMSPTERLPGYAGDEIYASLREYARRTKRGYAIGDNKGFVVNLPNRKSFSPDAAFFTGETSGMRFLQGAPIFAVEVQDPNNYGPAAEVKISAKRVDYFAAGTQLVWDVDLLSDEVVSVYRKENLIEPTVYRRGEIAEAEPAVPGWTMAVDSHFPIGD